MRCAPPSMGMSWSRQGCCCPCLGVCARAVRTRPVLPCEATSTASWSVTQALARASCSRCCPLLQAQSTERREFRLFCDVFHPERTLKQKILQGESHGHVSLQLRAVLYFYNTLLARHSCSFDCSCSSEWRSQLQKAVMTCDCDNEVVLTEVHQQC